MHPALTPFASVAAVAATGLAAALAIGQVIDGWDRIMAWFLADREREMNALRIDRTGLRRQLRLWGLAMVAGGLIGVLAAKPLAPRLATRAALARRLFAIMVILTALYVGWRSLG
jgi:hypothetical protein